MNRFRHGLPWAIGELDHRRQGFALGVAGVHTRPRDLGKPSGKVCREACVGRFSASVHAPCGCSLHGRMWPRIAPHSHRLARPVLVKPCPKVPSVMSRLSPRKLAIGVCAIGVLSLASCRSMVHRCEPREIPLAQRTVSPALVAATRDEQIERGKPRPVIDGLGWFFGIPGKIVLWDRRVENHDISAVTELAISDYLDDNQLDHVKVRLNQYAPLDDFRRLTKNKTVGWPYRYTIGALSVAGEAVFPGRLFGGDHYNPFTATVHL